MAQATYDNVRVGGTAEDARRRRTKEDASLDLGEDDDQPTSDDDDYDYDYDDYDDDPASRPPSRRRHYPSSSWPSLLFATRPHLAVLPVLLLEFLSLALTRAVLPSLLLRRYGSNTYVVMGFAECVRGVLAFFACPIFGRLSDAWGRRPCLLMTVFGTLAPVCSLAFWEPEGGGGGGWGGGGRSSSSSRDDYWDDRDVVVVVASSSSSGTAMEDGEASSSSGGGSWYPDPDAVGGRIDFFRSYYDVVPFHRIDVFVVLLALSGVCSSTFTLTFAYISDVVKDRDGRVAAYGLALATFGLSFTVGPLLGGYLANVDDAGRGHGGRDRSTNTGSFDGAGPNDDNSEIHPLGQHRVFLTSLILALLDLFYIHFLLPESLNRGTNDELVDAGADGGSHVPEEADEDDLSSTAVAAVSGTSNAPLPGAMGMGGGASSRRASPRRWNPLDSVRYLARDPVLSTVGRVTFLYYTALHAVVSTLVLYATRRFHLGPQRLGELMAALGLSTLISEAVLVRIAIPLLGETRCIRIGLASFSLQCVLLAVANSPWHLFGCAFLAMAGNLVYPSVSSLVSSTVRPDMVGRALGAINGVKSLTEGIGPLLFGTLLTMSEKDSLPGWPYFGAAIMVAMAFQVCRELPIENYTSNHAANFTDESIGLMDCPRKEDDDER